MRVTAAAASDVGRVREGNEDAYLVLEPLFVVADGMGGARGGEVASNLAIQTIRRLFEAGEGSLPDQVQEANRVVFERSQRDREVAGMGTTLTAALLEDGALRLAHVGDSRAYLLRDGELHLVTEDHTLVRRMVQAGEITAEQAETHPHRNILTRALGVDGIIDVDEGILELRVGDRVLLCTDGLTGMVRAEEIRAVLAGQPDPQEAVDLLVRAANRAGGVDNITALLLDVRGGDPNPGAARRRAETAAADEAASGEPAGAPRSHDTPVAPAPTPAPAPAPTRPSRPAGRVARSRRVRRIGIGAGAAIAVIVLSVVALRLYLDTQWFVGVSSGRVAVFRGVPAEVAGLDLHSVVVETTIPAEDAEALALYRELPDGITADDREGADEIVDQIRVDVAAAQTTEP
ncbi:MAG: Stp1/IreP family PP2C-type Ser/Thr phosphatase [Actinomycetota bacterium]